MYRVSIFFRAVVILLAAATTAWAAEQAQPVYVGSTICAKCHEEKFHLWQETLHANVIKDAKANPAVILGDFSVEDLGFKKDDVLFTVGSHWDQRYMTRIDGELYVLPKLWSVQSMQWRPYNVFSWRQRPWSRYCAGCHVTGYNPGNGEFKEMRIGCESCHGPGDAHARSSKAGDIVNPARLDQERRDMVCAACHVRGKDLSGQYYFAVGYRPGLDLGTLYLPLEKEDEEKTADAIKRIYSNWSKEREESGRGKCEVCGIYGSSDKLKDKMKMSDDIMAYCFKCHEFGNKLSSHTHHPENSKLVCVDCHRPKPFSVKKEKVDIHSVRYYRLHQESCYDEDVDLACISCHRHQEKDRAWASQIIMVSWRQLPAMNH